MAGILVRHIYPDYFFELQDKGILIYEGERNGKYIFREYFKNKATIEIEEDGFWRDIKNSSEIDTLRPMSILCS